MNDLNSFLVRISNWVSLIAKVLIGVSLIMFAVTTLTADLYIGYDFYLASGLTSIVALGLEGFPQLLANFLNFFFVTKGRGIEQLSLTARQWSLFVLTASVSLADAFKDAYHVNNILTNRDPVVVFLAVGTTFVASMFGEALLLFLPAMIVELLQSIDEEIAHDLHGESEHPG